VLELFNHPHPAMSRALFWQTLVSWEALRGEFFIAALDEKDQPVPLGRRGAKTRVARMIALDPDYFSHIVEGSQLMGWKYAAREGTSPVREQVLLPEEIIHSRTFNPYPFWRGLSPLTVAMLPGTSDYAAAQFMKGLMLNNADAGVIVTSKDSFSPEQQEQMIAAINERKRRAGTADRPLFLSGGVMVQKPAISSVDLQFLENRKLNRQEIGAIFKVPESMMGLAGQKNALSAGTAIEQDRLTFIESTIGSLCRRLEAAVEPIIRSFGEDLYGWFDLESLPILQQARRERMQTAEKAFAMGVPFNEINEVYDLGFGPLPWGDRGYLPANVVEAGRMPENKNQKDSRPLGQIAGDDAIEQMLRQISNCQSQIADEREDREQREDGLLSPALSSRGGEGGGLV
jgi:HK97 family phage portal protein